MTGRAVERWAPAGLSAVFDDPEVTELRALDRADGGATSGLLVAERGTASEDATVPVLLLDRAGRDLDGSVGTRPKGSCDTR